MKTTLKLIFVAILLISSNAFSTSIYGPKDLEFLHQKGAYKKYLFLQYILYNQQQASMAIGDVVPQEINRMAIDYIMRVCRDDMKCAEDRVVRQLSQNTITSMSMSSWMPEVGYRKVLTSYTNDGTHLFETYSDGKYKIGLIYQCKIMDKYGTNVCFLIDSIVA